MDILNNENTCLKRALEDKENHSRSRSKPSRSTYQFRDDEKTKKLEVKTHRSRIGDNFTDM